MTVSRRNSGGPIEYVVSAAVDLASIANPKPGEFALALAEGSLHYFLNSVWNAVAGGSAGGGVSIDTGGNVV